MKSLPPSFIVGEISMNHVKAICTGAASLAETVCSDVCKDRFGSITSLAISFPDVG